MAEQAIAVPHKWIASTFGRMTEADLQAFEKLGSARRAARHRARAGDAGCGGGDKLQ